MPGARVDFRTQDAAGLDEDAKRLIEAAVTLFRVSDASASLYMLPCVCFPFLTPVIRLLANAFPDAGLRQVQSHGCKGVKSG